LRDDSWRWAARCDLASGANWAVNPAVHDPMTMFSNGGPRPGYSWVAIQRAPATEARSMPLGRRTRADLQSYL